MRRAARIDSNQVELVNTLRKVGYSVLSLATLGKGCPDLLAGRRGVNWLIEVKDGSKPPSERRLTPDQETFHANWRGQIVVIGTQSELETFINQP